MRTIVGALYVVCSSALQHTTRCAYIFFGIAVCGVAVASGVPPIPTLPPLPPAGRAKVESGVRGS